MSQAPSFSAVRKVGSSTSSSSNNYNGSKPASFQRPIQEKPPSHQDVDPRAKKSDVATVEAGEAAKPSSRGDLTHGDNK
ncbi:hypothetical protein Tco_1519340 [Tanacetum coccineum]